MPDSPPGDLPGNGLPEKNERQKKPASSSAPPKAYDKWAGRHEHGRRRAARPILTKNWRYFRVFPAAAIFPQSFSWRRHFPMTVLFPANRHAPNMTGFCGPPVR
jgi:hypothetical protein